MPIKISSDIPLPEGRARATRESGEITEVIKSLLPGQSFFVPALDVSAAVVQKRITVRAVNMRKGGAISFFLVTRQVVEDYEDDSGDIVRNASGVRVWRAEATTLDSDQISLPIEEYHAETAL